MQQQRIITEATELRHVDNPLTTYAQFIHDLETGKASPGANRVAVNLRTLLGGFARFRGTEAQEKAIARFKGIHEASQLGGPRAVDPGMEPVDGGGINPEAIFEIGADARKAYAEATAYLGRMDTKRLVYVVIAEHGPTAYARHFGFGSDGRGIARAQVQVRRIADRLAELWGYQTRACTS